MSKWHDEIHKNVLMLMCCVEKKLCVIDYPGLNWITEINSKIFKLMFSGQNDHIPNFVCPSAVHRRSWPITGGAGRHCLRAYTWAT